MTFDEICNHLESYGCALNARLKADNERLKRVVNVYKASVRVHKGKCAELTMQLCEIRKENKRLRKLLWHAIALFCVRSCEYFNKIMSHCLLGQHDLYKRCEEKKDKYMHAVRKCRAKEEEYK